MDTIYNFTSIDKLSRQSVWYYESFKRCTELGPTTTLWFVIPYTSKIVVYKFNFPGVLKEAVDKACTKKAAIKGFRKCSLQPIDADAIPYERLVTRLPTEQGQEVCVKNSQAITNMTSGKGPPHALTGLTFGVSEEWELTYYLPQKSKTFPTSLHSPFITIDAQVRRNMTHGIFKSCVNTVFWIPKPLLQSTPASQRRHSSPVSSASSMV